MTTALFVLSIFMAVWNGCLIVMKSIYRERITAFHFLFFAAAITAIITKAIGMW